MNLKNVLATYQRVLSQLKHDRRTIALLLFIPSFISIILYFVLYDLNPVFNRFAPQILVLMAFTALFVVSSISTLRERSNGTFDRLMTLPISKLEIVVGYACAFGLMTLLQSIVSSLVVFGFLGVGIEGSLIQIMLLIILSGLSGMSFGLFISGFAKSEFQAVQFMPAFVFPQFLTSGLLVPREQMVELLQWFAKVTPLTYTVNGSNELASSNAWSTDFVFNLLILAGFTIIMLSLGSLTLRRQS